MKPKHTPGPWKLYPMSNGWSIYPACDTTQHDGSIVVHSHKRIVTDVCGFNWEDTEHSGNAALIAAAPDLVEALREAVESCPCSLKERDSGHRTDCRAPAWAEAIAKAEGRS